MKRRYSLHTLPKTNMENAVPSNDPRMISGVPFASDGGAADSQRRANEQAARVEQARRDAFVGQPNDRPDGSVPAKR